MNYEEFEHTIINCEDHDEILGWRIVKYSSGKYRCYVTIPGSFSGEGMNAKALQDSHEFKTIKRMYDFITNTVPNAG
jgi:hypothetical protein